MRRGGAGVYCAVGQVLVREDLDGGGEGSVGDGRDEDAGNDGLDSAIVAGHLLLVLCVGWNREKKTDDGVAGTEAAHDKPPDDEEDSANSVDGQVNFEVKGAFGSSMSDLPVRNSEQVQALEGGRPSSTYADCERAYSIPLIKMFSESSVDRLEIMRRPTFSNAISEALL